MKNKINPTKKKQFLTRKWTKGRTSTSTWLRDWFILKELYMSSIFKNEQLKIRRLQITKDYKYNICFNYFTIYSGIFGCGLTLSVFRQRPSYFCVCTWKYRGDAKNQEISLSNTYYNNIFTYGTHKNPIRFIIRFIFQKSYEMVKVDMCECTGRIQHGVPANWVQRSSKWAIIWFWYKRIHQEKATFCRWLYCQETLFLSIIRRIHVFWSFKLRYPKILFLGSDFIHGSQHSYFCWTSFMDST